MTSVVLGVMVPLSRFRQILRKLWLRLAVVRLRYVMRRVHLRSIMILCTVYLCLLTLLGTVTALLD